MGPRRGPRHGSCRPAAARHLAYFLLCCRFSSSSGPPTARAEAPMCLTAVAQLSPRVDLGEREMFGEAY